MNVIFTKTSWQQYVEWGLGKDEKLKYISAYSRRITLEHRLVYYFDESNNIVILSCKYHYQDK